MTEKRYNARRNEDNDDYRARLKAELEDVIGIVHTDEVTDSVELKKEYYKNQSKDKQYTYLNYSRDGYIGSFYENDKPLTNKEVYDLLNGQEELIKRLRQIREEQTETILKQKRKIKELETRNKRQYNRLKELTELMYERQWGKLENMVEEWEKQEELLQAEYGSYDDNDISFSMRLCEVTNEEQARTIVGQLNGLVDENEELKKENKFLRCTIESNSQDDYINYLKKQNEQLKKELFEARKDYLIETADISDKLYLEDEIEEERKEIFGDNND